MIADAPFSTKSQEAAGFIPVREGVLKRLGVEQIALYGWNDLADRPVLLRNAQYAVTVERAASLSKQHERVFYVRESDGAELCARMLASLESLMQDDVLSPAERFDLLQTAVSIEVDQALQQVCPDQYIALVSRVGRQVTALMSDASLLPRDLFEIARHDAFTFTHVTNVAGYATLLAQALGVSDRDTLDEIVRGAMLHDIGKRFIPHSILTKPGRLDAQEREVIQQHPRTGYEDLLGRKDVTRTQLMMVYQHHEHVDGGGYPVRILGDEIHPWARLLAVVDVFDAITGKRPYREPMPFSRATEFIADRAGTQFDEEMARCWVSTIHAK